MFALSSPSSLFSSVAPCRAGRRFALSLLSLALCAAYGISHAQETDPAPAPAPELTPAPSWSSFPTPVIVDTERLNSLQVIAPIRATAAYQADITGKGVTVAILDTGISLSHTEFTGKRLTGYNAIDRSTNVADGAGHGTHVAGILAGARDGHGMFGVAYDAHILPIKVLDDSGNGSTTYLDRGLRYAIGKAPIASMSLGAVGQYDATATKEAVAAGMLLVAAAGNDSLANPDWPARFAKEAWANNQIIAVGAVDANNHLAWYSNHAGDTANWYLVAPGSAIYSSYPANGYTTMSGTSMATPVVSGAAALIKQRWPQLRADQIATILFVTATDLGDPGIDTVYGRGLLNVEKALQPIGNLTTTTANGSTVKLLAGVVQVSSAVSRLWQLAAAGQLQVMGLDAYRRDFPVDLSGALSRPPAMPLEQVLGAMDRRVEVAENVLADGSRVALAWEQPLTRTGAVAEGKPQLTAFQWRANDVQGREMTMGTGGFAAQAFGAGDFQLGAALPLAALPALANPYFSLVPAATHLALGRQQDGVKFKFGLLSSNMNSLFAAQRGEGPVAIYNTPRASAAVLEVARATPRLAVSLSFAGTKENDAYLGAQSTSALLAGPHAATRSVQVAAAWLLTPRIALAGQLAYGLTPGIRSDGLITELAPARTNAFGLGLIAADSLRPGDRFSLTVSQPLRTYAGALALNRLTGITDDGTPTREQVRFSMVPQGRELRGELQYQMPVSASASVGWSLMLRHEPNHLQDAPLETLVACRYVQAF